MGSHGVLEERTSLEALSDNLPFEEIGSNMGRLGTFVLVSSERLESKEILSLYYTRVQMEQLSDRTKSNCSLFPLGIHGEEAFKGHLMLTFLSSILSQLLQKDMLQHTQEKASIDLGGCFLELRNQKCKVFDKVVRNPQGRCVTSTSS
ncbi:MAG: hypothetical protein RBR15_03140 [Sphaerochaeta sp.]|nr:hypothetical protein [Sphaerochaeta sp.]